MHMKHLKSGINTTSTLGLVFSDAMTYEYPDRRGAELGPSDHWGCFLGSVVRLLRWLLLKVNIIHNRVLLLFAFASF